MENKLPCEMALMNRQQQMERERRVQFQIISRATNIYIYILIIKPIAFFKIN